MAAQLPHFISLYLSYFVFSLCVSVTAFYSLCCCCSIKKSCPTLCDSHKLYIRRHWTISRDIRQGAKISLCEGIEIIQSLFSRHCGVMLEIDIKLSAKITHMFPSAVRHLPRETYDLAVEASMKLEG